MSIKDHIGEVHEQDAREAREAAIVAHNARKDYLERTVFKEHWLKITHAIVESGMRPDAQVSTPESIRRASYLIARKPLGSVHESFWTGRKSYYPPADKEWKSAVLAAKGSLQPAWDMQSYAEVAAPRYDGDNGLQFRFSRSGRKFDRLFLGQDATIYRATAIDPFQNSMSGSDFFPICNAMEMNYETHIAIGKALAHMAVRRELDIDF